MFMQIPFRIASKTIKYLGISFTKEAQDLYTENYKDCSKKLKMEIRGRTSHVYGLENLLLRWQ